MNELRPNKSEVEFLTLAYNRFYDIHEEVFQDEFWTNNAYYRFCKIREAFNVYAELLNYEPLKWEINDLKKTRPPIEAEIGSELFKFIRNIVAHFPFFDSWNDVYVNNSIVNWYRQGQTIDRFFKKYIGREEVKYRFWEEKKKKMTYLSITFPKVYDEVTNIYLKDILTEKEGVKFSLILMKQIVDTQVVKG